MALSVANEKRTYNNHGCSSLLAGCSDLTPSHHLIHTLLFPTSQEPRDDGSGQRKGEITFDEPEEKKKNPKQRNPTAADIAKAKKQMPIIKMSQVLCNRVLALAPLLLAHLRN